MQRLASTLLLCLVGVFGGCKRETPAMPESRFAFIVDDVFYIQPPVDRVIMVGTIQDGSVKAGDSVAVHTTNGMTTVVVEKIEHPKSPDIQQASKGDQVGLRVNGIRKEQVSKGDKVTGKSSE